MQRLITKEHKAIHINLYTNAIASRGELTSACMDGTYVCSRAWKLNNLAMVYSYIVTITNVISTIITQSWIPSFSSR